MSSPAPEAYEFGPYRIDPVERLLYRGDTHVLLAPKVTSTLLVLVQNAGHMVDKDALIKAVWPDTFVEEGALTRNISLLRRTLGDTGEEAVFIETIPRRGYRFIAPVQRSNPADPPAPPAAYNSKDRYANATEFAERMAGALVQQLLAAYVDRFVTILSRPGPTFQTIFGDLQNANQRLGHALAYAATSVVLGLCLARFVGLPKAPTEVDPKTAVAVLLIWILSALVLHPCLKVFRAKGPIDATVVVLLYAISTLHLLFIPALAIASHLITDTEVTLQYDYVVYFGTTNDHFSRFPADEVKKWPLSMRRFLSGIRTESYVKEREPHKEGTILPPAPPLQSLPNPDIPTSPSDRKRVPLGQAGLPSPQRTEKPVIRAGYDWILFGFWILYYLINSAYLAFGLAVAHRMSAFLLLSLAVVGAPMVMLLMLLILAVKIPGL